MVPDKSNIRRIIIIMSVKVDMTNETDFNTMIGQVGNMLEDMWNQYNFVLTSIRDNALVSGKPMRR